MVPNRVGVAALGILMACAGALAAAPPPFDAAKANLPLRARPVPEVQAMLQLAASLETTAEEGLRTYQDKRGQPAEFAKLSPAIIGKTYQSVVQLRRVGEWLQLWGEAAGVDYQRRAARQERELLVLVEAYKALPDKAAMLARSRTQLKLLIDQRRGGLPALARLVQQKKFDAAETELNETYDLLEIMLVFYDNSAREDAHLPFATARDAIYPPANNLRKEQAMASLSAARANVAMDFAALTDAISAATTSLKASGLASVGGESVGGPEALRRYAAQWQQVQMAAMRYRALSWQMGIQERQNPPSDIDRMLADYRDLDQAMPAALASLIEADAARVTPQAARPLYLQYLASCASVVGLGPPGVLNKAFEPALATLAARSPTLSAEVASYRKLTREVLRWRRLAADTVERAAAPAYAPLDDKLLPAFKAVPPYPGLVVPNANNLGELRLFVSAPEALEKAYPLLAGQQVVCGDATPIGAKDGRPLLTTRYRNRTIVTFTLPEGIAAEVAKLKADLFVTDATPAMTLEAAAAIASAERGALLRVGGAVGEQSLEPLATYFALLPDTAAGLVPLGPLPQEPAAMPAVEHVLARVTLEPEWLRHDCFFWQAPKK